MSRYGRIESGFWHSVKVRAVSDDARYLMLYLLSCPHGNAVGCFVLRGGYIADDIGWEAKRISNAFEELSTQGLAERDDKTFLTRICGWFGHNKIDNHNVAKHIVKEIALLPNCPVRDNLIADLLSLSNPIDTVSETLSKGLPKPLRTHNIAQHNTTEPNIDILSGKPDVPPGKVLKFGEPHGLEKPIDGDLPGFDLQLVADFEEWYALYPRKEARGKALKAYRTARKRVSREVLLEAIKTPRPEFAEAKFRPLPASWLNAERWADERAANKPAYQSDDEYLRGVL